MRQAESALEGLLPFLRRFGWLEAGFVAVFAVALAMRLWELGGRAMHYDEGIHVHYAWRLANSDGVGLGWPWLFGDNYLHAPWMHGPFQIEMTAAVFTIFGDTEFTARLGYALFGAALVVLPYFLRDHLGSRGALLAAVMLALSPVLLYFSRFGRNDIIMVFFASALLVLMWRYLHGGRRVHLYLASAVLACMFATKETVYLVVGVFGLMLILMAVRDFWNGRVARAGFSAGFSEGTAAAFFLLLATLTLPQWAAIAGLFQDFLGLTLANPDPLAGHHVYHADGSKGLVGAPAWVGRTLLLPVADVHWAIHATVVVVGLTALAFVLSRRPPEVRRTVVVAGLPLLAVAGIALLLFRPMAPFASLAGFPVADLLLAFLAAAAAVTVSVCYRVHWQLACSLVLGTALGVVLYSVLLTPVLDLQAVLDTVLPETITVEAAANGIPANYVVALVLLLGTLLVSVVVGVRWLGGVWLGCAAVFYLVWAAFYTTMFTNLAGLFSGSWQGMGYWIAQQDVARGNQPWYYYFVGLSVYELLPWVFGLAGAVFFWRNRDHLGLALAFWAIVTLVGYTVASEKMPWLLVNLTVPFIFVAAKFLGELAGRVEWRESLREGGVFLLVLAPATAAGAVYLLLRYVGQGFDASHWVMLAATVILAVAAAVVIRTASPGRGAPVAALGFAALLLAFGTWGAVRAGYTYDDSNVEVLVYAQGSADLVETYRTMQREVFSNPSAPALSEQPVRADYEAWYPFQWYVRHQEQEGSLRFSCFKSEGQEGWKDSCRTVEQRASDELGSEGRAPVLMVAASNASTSGEETERYTRTGPHKDLLWFPESYRRPDENRESESFGSQIVQDLRFFKETAANRESWNTALRYMLFRELDDPWFKSEYYHYLQEGPG